MPCYRLLAYARPDATPSSLAESFRNIARVVYREKGQFRTIDNLGVRPLAYREKSRGERFNEARFVSCVYDVAPDAKGIVEQVLKNDANLIRFFH